MKIVIGIIVVLGLGWLLLGTGGEEATTPETPTEEVMEEGSMTDEGAMEEGDDHSDDSMMEEGDDHSDDSMMEAEADVSGSMEAPITQ